MKTNVVGRLNKRLTSLKKYDLDTIIFIVCILVCSIVAVVCETLYYKDSKSFVPAHVEVVDKDITLADTPHNRSVGSSTPSDNTHNNYYVTVDRGIDSNTSDVIRCRVSKVDWEECNIGDKLNVKISEGSNYNRMDICKD